MLETESDSVGFPRAAVILTFVGLECRFRSRGPMTIRETRVGPIGTFGAAARVSRIAADLIARGFSRSLCSIGGGEELGFFFAGTIVGVSTIASICPFAAQDPGTCPDREKNK